jgi:hypothetical protein
MQLERVGTALVVTLMLLLPAIALILAICASRMRERSKAHPRARQFVVGLSRSIAWLPLGFLATAASLVGAAWLQFGQRPEPVWQMPIGGGWRGGPDPGDYEPLHSVCCWLGVSTLFSIFFAPMVFALARCLRVPVGGAVASIYYAAYFSALLLLCLDPLDVMNWVFSS